MKKLVAFCLVLGVFACLCGCGGKEKQKYSLENVVQESDTKITCTFDGVEHYFNMCFPEKTEGAPLVLMLHGHGESPESFSNMSHFEDKANGLGYGVVYVSGSVQPGDPVKVKGWNSGIYTEGNRDVEFLVTVAEYLQENYLFDTERTYAAGFSNGAFMTHRLAMEASDTFSAVVSVAGKMPKQLWEDKNKRNNVSVLQITGEKDDVVPKNIDGSGNSSLDPAIEDVMEYWATSNGLGLAETVEVGARGTLTKYESDEKTAKVWHVFIKDARHSWYGEKINKVDSNTVILDFFESMK